MIGSTFMGGVIAAAITHNFVRHLHFNSQETSERASESNIEGEKVGEGARIKEKRKEAESCESLYQLWNVALWRDLDRTGPVLIWQKKRDAAHDQRGGRALFHGL